MYFTKQSQNTLFRHHLDFILLVKVLSVKVEPDLRHKVILLLRCHWLEVETPGCLEGEEASLQEVERVTELPLNAQEVSEVDQALVVVEVSLQKLDQLPDVISCLNPLELFLKTDILWRLDEGKDLLACLFIYPYKFHAKYLVNLRPLRVRLHKQALLALANSGLFLHPFNHLQSSLHLLACSLVLLCKLPCTSISFIFLFLLVQAKSPICLS